MPRHKDTSGTMPARSGRVMLEIETTTMVRLEAIGRVEGKSIRFLAGKLLAEAVEAKYREVEVND